MNDIRPVLFELETLREAFSRDMNLVEVHQRIAELRQLTERIRSVNVSPGDLQDLAQVWSWAARRFEEAQAGGL